METINFLKLLRNIKTDDLANVMNIKPSMARKYKKEPWKYDPPTSKAIAVESDFGIPVYFWKYIKSYIDESVSGCNDITKVHETKI